MIARMCPLGQIYLYFMMLVFTACFMVLAYWECTNIFTVSSTVTGSHIVGLSIVPIGADVTVEYAITRNRACSLEITRILKRTTIAAPYSGEEFQVGMTFRSFITEAKPLLANFVITIPKNAVPGEYELFTRIRYYCNGLDWLFPRFLITESVKVTVI